MYTFEKPSFPRYHSEQMTRENIDDNSLNLIFIKTLTV